MFTRQFKSISLIDLSNIFYFSFFFSILHFGVQVRFLKLIHKNSNMFYFAVTVNYVQKVLGFVQSIYHFLVLSQASTSQGYFPKWQLPKCAISQATMHSAT